ncbi:MAG TPA: hypothetical protein VHS78_17800 [Candidatus Elarobacter sp.]|jgi:hypothetical protein|nr:hypothetical protein [Candidatus Elarobacter sp.]
MLTLHLPMLLALLGTVLMAVVIFAPVPVPAAVTMSFAPPLRPPRDHPASQAWTDTPPFESTQSFESESALRWPDTVAMDDVRFPVTQPAEETTVSRETRWPVLVDPSAFECDASTRLALVGALASVRAPWADEILRRALDDEHDAAVREAIVLATGAPAVSAPC